MRLLVVEDQKNVARFISKGLREQAYAVDVAFDGMDALYHTDLEEYDLIILDVMLPKIDGFEVCRRLRASRNDTAILMLTARDEDIDKILGLELGADDYLTKPFNPRELVARVKAILRRGGIKDSVETKPIRVGDLTIDPARREARINARTLDLRTQEFDLLLTLAEHRGLVLTREQILQQAWGFDFYGQTRTVDVHVAHLRKKLDGSSVKIETVTGVGYKLAANR
jgi:DNA-binding response OmpR family regulator